MHWQSLFLPSICHEHHTDSHTAVTARADMALAGPFPREASGMKESRDGSPILWSTAAFDISSHQLQKSRRKRGEEKVTLPTTATTHEPHQLWLSFLFCYQKPLFFFFLLLDVRSFSSPLTICKAWYEVYSEHMLSPLLLAHMDEVDASQRL